MSDPKVKDPRYCPEHQTPEGCGPAPDITEYIQGVGDERLACSKCKAARAEEKKQSDILNPSPAILAALASAVIHAEEFMSPGGHHYDLTAFSQCVDQPPVREWLAAMTKAGFASVRRS